MEIRISDLPELSKSRLMSALKKPPQETFVIRESRLSWAFIALIIAMLCLFGVYSQAANYKWPSDERLLYLFVTIGSFIMCWQSAAYLIGWFRHDFKPQVLINPLYFLRFRFNRIEAIQFTGEKVWRIQHLQDTRGAYTGTRFYFTSETGQQKILKTASVRTANDLIEGLNRFPDYVSDLVRRQDTNALYFFDLLFEWRMREKQFPSAPYQSPRGFAFVLRKLGPALLASLFAIVTFLSVVEPYNDYRDDELRWNTAKSSSSATGYRLYMASRPDGRHISDAHAAIAKLYESAAERYRMAPGDATPEGIEVVIKMLEYAKNTDNYKVVVTFTGENEIPPDIEARLRRTTGLSRIVPILPSFTSAMNQTRETRILEKISESFGKVIPGDILQFAVGQPSAQEIGFTANYLIRASGGMYYPVRQEHVSEANRDWYTGIAFDWSFHITIPGSESSNFQFVFKSEPAQLFNVGYTRSTSEGTELVPTEVYSAMADSAFEDFGSKLHSQLAGR
ncbi:MAG: hypothetical protein NVS9B13_15090 [Candidatus Acidiferrum sp.]